MQSIANSILEISVQEKGAELCSIRSIATGKEFMWNADPSIWNSFAPVLFPIIGCLKDGIFIYKGKKYSVPKHGFIRNNENLQFSKIGTECLEFSLQFDEESLKNYPFEFEFKIRYYLRNNSIEVQHEVINHSVEEALYFSLGGHPAFRCPLNESEQYDDYYLEFEHIENVSTWAVLPSGLIGEEARPLLKNTKYLPLTRDLFNKDALILKDLKSRKVSLKSHLSRQVIQVDFTDFPYLGIWAKPGGNFICIEPWLGISDSANSNQEFTSKEGILCLNQRSSFKASYFISIFE